MILTYGSLCAGMGGLDMGVQSVLGGETVWFSEFDKAPSKILAHHWPDVPNLGDMTKIDWTTVRAVDVLTGGTPCQDLSHAGKRAGMTEGTRSNLWVQMREAIAALRPRLVVWENVRGAYSAEADSELEQCPRCVGDPRDRGAVLRALGRVLGDLSDLGYDSWWYGLRAADVGACHGRFRVFVFAVPAADAGVFGRQWQSGLVGGGWAASVRRKAGGHPRDGGVAPADLTPLLPTPTARLGDSSSRGASHPDRRKELCAKRGGELDEVAIHLLPTPAVNDMGAAYTPDEWDEWTDRMKAKHGNGNGHGPSLTIEAQRSEQSWGDYEAAIRRHEALVGRPAPAPTEAGPKGGQRLSPRFVEWMMCLPDGHVTDPDIGISRNDQLKALGNGVVPPQAAEATLRFLRDVRVEAVA